MKLICVEGCIGVGKSTVATQLASVIDGANTLLEDFSRHPFLEDFYTDSKFTFETELSFMLIHYHQLFKLMEEPYKLLISDYFFLKDKLFADVNILTENELTLFMQLYNYLQNRLVKPSAVICLSGTTEMIFNRIKTRNREVETNISYDYIDKINKHYEILFSEIKKNYYTININMDKNDFVKKPELINIIKNKLVDDNIC